MNTDSNSTSNPKRINNGDIWSKLTEMEKKLVEISTNQKWMRESFEDVKTYHAEGIREVKTSVEGLRLMVNDEITAMTNRVAEVEKSSWYQKGFYAGIGAVASLLAILIPNLNKLF